MCPYKYKVVASHGLGNQLFQFAFAHFLFNKNLAEKVLYENSPIVSKLGDGKSANFKMQNICNYCNHLQHKTNSTISNYSIYGRVLFKSKLSDRFAKKLLEYDQYSNEIVENRINSFKFVPFSFPSESTIFRGFWQHYKYVVESERILLDEISQLILNESRPIETLLNLNDTKFIAVHVRRGDFLIRNREQELGLVSEDSYLEILQNLQESFGKLPIFTFTDDENLLQNFRHRKSFGVILGPNFKVFDTLHAFSKAHVVVAANSNLSWWGGVLARNLGAHVYMPRRYYKNLETFDAYQYPGFNYYDNEFD